jgi:hypothetical protein
MATDSLFQTSLFSVQLFLVKLFSKRPEDLSTHALHLAAALREKHLNQTRASAQSTPALRNLRQTYHLERRSFL